MEDSALDRTLARLDLQDLPELPRKTPTTASDFATGHWKWVAPGIRMMRLMDRDEDDARLDLLRVAPGVGIPDHGHSGTAPVIWLDALDLPLFMYLEGSYAVEAPLQATRNRPDPSEVEYATAGLAPPRRRNAPPPAAFPQMRYPWARTEAALRRMAPHYEGQAVELDYINPETGGHCMHVLGFTAMMLRPGEALRPDLKSASALFHVIAGQGSSVVNGVRHDWTSKDSFSAPVFAEIEHRNTGSEPAFLIRVHDQPLQEKLGYYEERAR